jgi:hypothetical protein
MRLSSKLLATLPFPMSFKTKFSRLTSHVIEIRLHGRGITLFAWVFWTHQSEGFGLSPKKVAATSLSLDQAREIANQVRIYQKQQRAKTDTPESVVEQVVEDARTSPETYRGEVFDLLLKLPSGGFERLSQRLLREAGFIQVVVTGRSGDGGIDGHGTLQINPLVSFKVVFQCKRYAKSVSPSQVVPIKGSSSQLEPLPPRRAAKRPGMAHRQSTLSMEINSSICWSTSNLASSRLPTMKSTESSLPSSIAKRQLSIGYALTFPRLSLAGVVRNSSSASRAHNAFFGVSVIVDLPDRFPVGKRQRFDSPPLPARRQRHQCRSKPTESTHSERSARKPYIPPPIRQRNAQERCR